MIWLCWWLGRQDNEVKASDLLNSDGTGSQPAPHEICAAETVEQVTNLFNHPPSTIHRRNEP